MHVNGNISLLSFLFILSFIEIKSTHDVFPSYCYKNPYTVLPSILSKPFLYAGNTHPHTHSAIMDHGNGRKQYLGLFAYNEISINLFNDF